MSSPPARWKLALAFATVYLVWGSTYLAIRVGVASLPPALFAGFRWVVAGVALSLFARLRGENWPTELREWRIIAAVGILLIGGGNGLVVWGEQWVASNIAALIIASTALWIAGLGSIGKHGEAVRLQAKTGLALGFAGVILLLLPGAASFSQSHAAGQLLIALAAISWASGTILARRSRPRTPTLMSASLQMVVGGVLLSVIGLALGETARWSWSWTGSVALAYLTVFGSLAFVAYVWLTQATTPAKLGTYAYVNPAIAVLLGWWLLGEELNELQIFGTLVILVGVVLVTTPTRNTAR